MPMTNLGTSSEDMEGDEDRVWYPTLYISGDEIEGMGLSDAKVGSDMMMTAKVRLARRSDSQDGENSVTIEVIEAEVKPKEDGPDAAKVLFPDG